MTCCIKSLSPIFSLKQSVLCWIVLSDTALTGWHYSFFPPHIAWTYYSLLFLANPQVLVFTSTQNPFSLNLSDFLPQRKKVLYYFSVLLIFFRRSYSKEKLLNEFVQEIQAVFLCDVQGIMKCHKNEKTINITCGFHLTNDFPICHKKSLLKSKLHAMS